MNSPNSDKLKLKTISEINAIGLDVKKIIINNNLTKIREHEMEMACMANKKDTEKKEFNWKFLSATSFVVLTAVGIGTAALGGKLDFKLPKKN